jgi:hypothetical protein
MMMTPSNNPHTEGFAVLEDRCIVNIFSAKKIIRLLIFLYQTTTKQRFPFPIDSSIFDVNPRANGADRRSGRKPGARVLIPTGYLHPGKGTH